MSCRPVAVLQVLLVASMSTFCRQSPGTTSAQRARQIADASTSEQAALWRAAAANGTAVGLDRVPVAEAQAPSSVRPLDTAPSQALPSQNVSIPAQVIADVRILSAPVLGPAGFSGTATVSRVGPADRVDLDIGQQRTISVLARVNRGPLATRLGDMVRVTYRTRKDPDVPNDGLTIKTAAGAGIVQLVAGSASPVTADEPLFGLRLAQMGTAPAMTVDVSVNGVHRTMVAGDSAQVNGLTVLIVSNIGRDEASAARTEGPRYVVNVLAWRT